MAEQLSVVAGLVRVSLEAVRDGHALPKSVPGLSVEVDIGDGWPNHLSLTTLARLLWRSDRLIVLGTDAAAVAYSINYLRQQQEEQRAVVDPLPVDGASF